MRNIFDQYDQLENKLTHALVCSLNEDKSLLKPFLQWLGVKDMPTLKEIGITEQNLPGDWLESSSISEDQGLPDACIYDKNEWAVIVESKIQSPISKNQLERHIKSMARKGYPRPYLVLFSVDKPTEAEQKIIHCHKEWKDIYAWFASQANKSVWAKHFSEYVEIFEAKSIESEYEIRGTLTMFNGFHFDKENPYTYNEGKRLIRLIRDEFRENKKLFKELALDCNTGAGRKAITKGHDGTVWGYFPLKINAGKTFTEHPHATFEIQPTESSVAITIPNSLKRNTKKCLKEIEIDNFKNVIGQIIKNLAPVYQKVPSCNSMLYLIQRHYPSQRSNPIQDGFIEIDLRSIVDVKHKSIKYQPMWLEAIYQILINKRANIQFGMAISFPHTEEKMQTKEAVIIMADTWIALKEFLEVFI